MWLGEKVLGLIPSLKKKEKEEEKPLGHLCMAVGPADGAEQAVTDLLHRNSSKSGSVLDWG